MGTVEEINLRTTFVRAIDNTLITIPNSKLVNDAIDNISARQNILSRTILRLRYDTGPTQRWPEFLEIAEELNIQILEIIAAAGTSLSLPITNLQGLHG